MVKSHGFALLIFDVGKGACFWTNDSPGFHAKKRPEALAIWPFFIDA
jgi:hypothetical protein